jgi:hypothetical protein
MGPPRVSTSVWRRCTSSGNPDGQLRPCDIPHGVLLTWACSRLSHRARRARVWYHVMPSPFAHFFDRWLPDAIRNLTNNELHSQDAVISWLQEALYENERTEGWRLYFTRRGGARELPPRAPRSARGGRLLPAAPGRATAAGGERQIGEGMGGNQVSPSSCSRRLLAHNPAISWEGAALEQGCGETWFPHPLPPREGLGGRRPQAGGWGNSVSP